MHSDVPVNERGEVHKQYILGLGAARSIGGPYRDTASLRRDLFSVENTPLDRSGTSGPFSLLSFLVSRSDMRGSLIATRTSFQ